MPRQPLTDNIRGALELIASPERRMIVAGETPGVEPE
jgi:hypothetical protein